MFSEVTAARTAVAKELKAICNEQQLKMLPTSSPVNNRHVVSAIQTQIECLAANQKLLELGEKVKTWYPDVISSITHANVNPLRLEWETLDQIKMETRQEYIGLRIKGGMRL